MTQHYLFPRTQREYQRQALQSQVWERATRQALQSVGPQLGGRVLDVGCGCGGALPLLAEHVGPNGYVTGVDIDAEAPTESLATKNGSCTDSYQFIEADITEDDISNKTWKEGSFDLVFARMILLHIQRPGELLKRLWQWVRPGGSLLIMDYDLTSSSSFPQHPVIERALRFSIDTFRRDGLDIEMGSRVPELFCEAGLPPPDGCDIASMILPAAPSVHALRETLSSLQPAILRSRLADEATLAKTDRELAEAANAQVHVRWPDMVATWKRKGM